MRYKSLLNFPLTALPKPSKELFYIVAEGRKAGPFSEAELRVLVKNGSIFPETLVWSPNLVQWTQAQYVPCINKLLLLAKKPKKTTSGKIKQTEENPIRKDLINALTGLGYKNNFAASEVDRILDQSPDISIEDGLKQVLKNICR